MAWRDAEGPSEVDYPEIICLTRLCPEGHDQTQRSYRDFVVFDLGART